MFIEASLPRKQGDAARLVSESMTKHWSTNVPYCLRFWYHMTGSGIGTLNLYVKTDSSSQKERLIWSLSGNQANWWKYATAPIYSILDYQVFRSSFFFSTRYTYNTDLSFFHDGCFITTLLSMFCFWIQLVFEAIIGTNVQGDIALDDIVYSLGRCPVYPSQADPTFTTTPVPTTTLSM